MYSVVHITMALWVTATLFYGTKCKFLHFICHQKHTNRKNADEIKRESHCVKGAHYSQPFERLIFALFSGWFCFLFHPLCVCELWLCAYILLKTLFQLFAAGIGCKGKRRKKINNVLLVIVFNRVVRHFFRFDIKDSGTQFFRRFLFAGVLCPNHTSYLEKMLHSFMHIRYSFKKNLKSQIFLISS